jgi:hypothetical protein
MLHDLQNLMGTSMAVRAFPAADGANDLTVIHSVVVGPRAKGSSSAEVGG